MLKTRIIAKMPFDFLKNGTILFVEKLIPEVDYQSKEFIFQYKDKPDNSFTINNLGDLEGRINITSKASALSYVRLRTCPYGPKGNIQWCFGQTCSEVYTDKHMLYDPSFGSKEQFDAYRKNSDFVLRQNNAFSWKLFPKVEIKNGIFYITRTVVFKSRWSNKSYTLNEVVDNRGSFIKESREELKVDLFHGKYLLY